MTERRFRRLRVVSYNVHGCVGLDGRFMPERIAAIVASLDADFCAVQEVEDREYAGARVSEFLAARLDMHVYRGSTLRRGAADYGNLLLARHAAVVHRLHDISVVGREPRGVVEGRFRVAGSRLRLCATHLGLRVSERNQQVRRLASLFTLNDVDLNVLAGDMNEWRPFNASLRELRSVFGITPRRRTFPSTMPSLALDRIFVSPRQAIVRMNTLRTAESRVASDHLPIVCDLAVSR